MSEEKNTNELKVITLGLQDKVYDAMKKPGFSAEALAREFTADGVKITAQSIRKFIKKTKKAQQVIIQQDMKLSNELVKTAMDYNKALKDILNEVEEVKNEAKDDKDYTTYNQLIGRLLQGIELFAKLTGDMKPKGSGDINIIYNQISEDVDKDMRDVRKQMFDKMNAIDIDYEVADEDKEVEQQLKKGEI
jgi:hypothetical protein